MNFAGKTVAGEDGLGIRVRGDASVVAALSELAAEVQKRRTVTEVLETAGQGILRLGMRLYGFELSGHDLVLR
uniref:hypothetical protein n=1 Tax=Klebsiella pneumoniae TaxID=573 RepID=UPI0030098FDD